MITALAPVIGYDKAAEIAKKSFETGVTVRQLLLQEKLLPEEQVNRILDPWKMTEPGIAKE